MRNLRRLTALTAALLTIVAGISACSMATSVAWETPEHSTRELALRRWAGRAFDSYRIVLRVEALGRVCFQEIEVSGQWVRRIARNTCDTLWVDTMTVEDLFDLGDEIERIPSSRCGPPPAPCACHRVFTRREVSYDEGLGYPTMVLARSELQANWSSPDLWRSVVAEGVAPACGMARRRLTVQVLALVPSEP